MAEDMTFLPKSEVLSLEELEKLCAAFIRQGVTKLRLTGGEPLVRKDVMSLIRRLGARIGNGLEELTLTTNGSQLAKYADAIAEAGVKRINVSLDTLDAAKFTQITRRGRLPPVLEGLQAAKAAGLQVKINTVALKNINEDEFDALIAWCGTQKFDLCLIETMPMGETGPDRMGDYLPLSTVRRRLEQNWTLTPSAHVTGGPARYLSIAETGQRLGLITPLTQHFCDSCNRVRLTCTGTLYMCLGQTSAADLRTPLRTGANLDAAIIEAISRKPKSHDFGVTQTPAIARHMSVTGG
jgi:cyclic pyranopterin phosphate synthase